MGIGILAASGGPANTDAVFTGVILAIAGVLLYFLPLFIGWRRHVRHLGALAVVNVFTGWTLIGWVAALVMAVWPKEPVTRSAGG